MNDRLTHLLSTKDYYMLSDEEKLLVSKHLDMEEYMHSRLDIVSEKVQIAKEMKQITPDQQLLQHLLKESRTKTNFWSRFAGYKIGLPKVAAMLAVLVSIQVVFWWQNQNSKVEIRYISQTDTIVQKQDIHHYDTVYLKNPTAKSKTIRKINKGGAMQPKASELPQSRNNQVNKKDARYYQAQRNILIALQEARRDRPRRKKAPKEPCNICEIDGLIMSDQLSSPLSSLEN